MDGWRQATPEELDRGFAPMPVVVDHVPYLVTLECQRDIHPSYASVLAGYDPSIEVKAVPEEK